MPPFVRDADWSMARGLAVAMRLAIAVASLLVFPVCLRARPAEILRSAGHG